jgi:hypothetical protein
MSRDLGGWGCPVLIAIVVGPGVIAAYLLNSARWVIIGPITVVALMLITAALPFKRKITPQQWADELEKHLLGTDGAFGWDDAISTRLADKRLESLRARLSDFDSRSTPEKREEFRQIIEALRRGEFPQ